MSQSEIHRHLHEMALSIGRTLQSPQTGFIHYFPQPFALQETYHTIPIYENFLFALTLLRTRTTEGISEGKTLLNKLLPFQTKEGNFPLNLHEYPICYDHYLAIQLLPCLHAIVSTFSSVLGAELAQKLNQTATNLLDYALKISKETVLPDTFLIKLGASAKAFGKEEGVNLLEAAPKTGQSLYWYTPSLIADVLISLQMIYPSISNSPWSDFWEHVQKTWHHPTCSYIGPGLKEFQKFGEPEPTLYDLQLGAYTGVFSKRAKTPAPFHLQAVLINPRGDDFNLKLLPLTYSGTYHNQSWTVVQHPSYAYSTLLRNRSTEQGFHPFRLIFGNADQTDTFVMQGGNWKTIQFEQVKDGIDFTLEMETPSTEEDREKQRELIFYTNLSDHAEILINGEISNTFLPGQPIEIAHNLLKMQLTLIANGVFQGHLMRGNRPSQIGNKGIYRFEAYDLQIFLRTLKRDHPCSIQAQLRIL